MIVCVGQRVEWWAGDSNRRRRLWSNRADLLCTLNHQRDLLGTRCVGVLWARDVPRRNLAKVVHTDGGARESCVSRGTALNDAFFPVRFDGTACYGKPYPSTRVLVGPHWHWIRDRAAGGDAFLRGLDPDAP